MHIIRLRGPWRLEPVARFARQADGTYRPESDHLPAAAKLTMPADWSAALGSDFLGRVRHTRTFNTPTGLEADARVYVVIEPPRSFATVMLGGESLGHVNSSGPAGRFDITDRLGSHNRLEIDVDHPALDEDGNATGDPMTFPPGGLIGEVRLEIEE